MNKERKKERICSIRWPALKTITSVLLIAINDVQLRVVLIRYFKIKICLHIHFSVICDHIMPALAFDIL
jgi:hypothetical protein